MPTVLGAVTRNDDLVSLTDADLVITTRASVRLLRLIWLDVPHVDAVVGFRPPMRTHNARHGTAALFRIGARRTVAPCRTQAAGSGERAPARASSTLARSGSRTLRSQAPCHSHAALHTGHDRTTEPPDQASASMGVLS